jgi:integrase/recombinase XerD
LTPVAAPHITQAQLDLDAYLAKQQRLNRAAGTLKKYGQILGEFVEWVGDRRWDEISARGIETEYLTPWMMERQPKPNTVRLRVTALKSLFAYLERIDAIDRDPMRKIDAPKAERRINDWLRPDEDEAVLAAVRRPIERIVVNWLRFTGLRVEEAQGVLNRDVDLVGSKEARHGQVTVRHSKTVSGIRVIPIFPELRPEIGRWRGYQQAIGLDDPDLPFLGTKNGTPMSHTQIWRTVKRIATRAGVRVQEAPDRSGWNTSTVSPHTLRRTTGSSLINAGVPLNVVSKILGHNSTTITERCYAELTSESIAASVLSYL